MRVGNSTSATLTLNTGALRGGCLVPSFTLFTHDYVAAYDSNTIIKFADNMAVVGLITNDDETAYREEFRDLAVWGQNNNLLCILCIQKVFRPISFFNILLRTLRFVTPYSKID